MIYMLHKQHHELRGMDKTTKLICDVWLSYIWDILCTWALLVGRYLSYSMTQWVTQKKTTYIREKIMFMLFSLWSLAAVGELSVW